MDTTQEIKVETLDNQESTAMDTLLHQNLRSLLASSKKLPGSFPNADDPSLYMDKPSRNTNISWFWKFIKQETNEEGGKFKCMVEHCDVKFSRKKSSNPSKAIKRHFMARADHAALKDNCMGNFQFSDNQNQSRKRNYSSIETSLHPLFQELLMKAAKPELSSNDEKQDSAVETSSSKTSSEGLQIEEGIDVDILADKVVHKMLNSERFMEIIEKQLDKQSSLIAEKIAEKILKTVQ